MYLSNDSSRPVFYNFYKKVLPTFFAHRVEKLLRRTFTVGTRGFPPSWLEFQVKCIPLLFRNHDMYSICLLLL